MNQTAWNDVDDYIADHLVNDDNAFSAALQNNAENGLPAIDVSAAQGKMLFLLAKMVNAKNILEIGTLGGYSTIWLSKSLPEKGLLVTLELDPHHAEVARQNLVAAGVADKVVIHVGTALESLVSMTDEAPFDLIFIDADKQNNVRYFEEALRLSRSGTTIIVDNVVRGGDILDANSVDERVIGTRALFQMLANEPRIDATAIQTTGAKGWDGFVLAVVR